VSCNTSHLAQSACPTAFVPSPLTPAAREPPVSRGHPRHRAVSGRGDRAPSRPRAHRTRTVDRRASRAKLLLGRALGREAAMVYGPPRGKADAKGRIWPMRGLPLFFFPFYLNNFRNCLNFQNL
jgi:hypothetical protein